MSAPETLKGEKPATTIAVQASQIEMLERRCGDLIDTRAILERQIESMTKSAVLARDSAKEMQERIRLLSSELDAMRQSASRLQGYIDRVREEENPAGVITGTDWATGPDHSVFTEHAVRQNGQFKRRPGEYER